MRWQNPKTDANGRKPTEESEKCKSLASCEFRLKGLSSLRFLKARAKTPCLPAKFEPRVARRQNVNHFNTSVLDRPTVGARTSFSQPISPFRTVFLSKCLGPRSRGTRVTFRGDIFRARTCNRGRACATSRIRSRSADWRRTGHVKRRMHSTPQQSLARHGIHDARSRTRALMFCGWLCPVRSGRDRPVAGHGSTFDGYILCDFSRLSAPP